MHQFKFSHTQDSFDFTFAIGVHKAQLQKVAGLAIIKWYENVLLLVLDGNDQMHLVIPLRYAAAQATINMRFISVADLLMTLSSTHRRDKLEDVFRYFVNPHRLLIIDQMEYSPMNQERANIFFRILVKRYKRDSPMVISNLPFGQSDRTLSGDASLTAPILEGDKNHL